MSDIEKSNSEVEVDIVIENNDGTEIEVKEITKPEYEGQTEIVVAPHENEITKPEYEGQLEIVVAPHVDEPINEEIDIEIDGQNVEIEVEIDQPEIQPEIDVEVEIDIDQPNIEPEICVDVEVDVEIPPQNIRIQPESDADVEIEFRPRDEEVGAQEIEMALDAELSGNPNQNSRMMPQEVEVGGNANTNLPPKYSDIQEPIEPGKCPENTCYMAGLLMAVQQIIAVCGIIKLNHDGNDQLQHDWMMLVGLLGSFLLLSIPALVFCGLGRKSGDQNMRYKLQQIKKSYQESKI